jgi:superfamily I DNA and/or RNA helicase
MHHESLEDERYAAHTTSRTNVFMVTLVAAPVSHLVRWGVYRSNDIAVLTPYLGQLRKIKARSSSAFDIVLGDRDTEELSKGEAGDTAVEDSPSGEPNAPIAKSSLLETLRLATVDNFQEQEAKITIVSLVRSNKKNNCGCLKTSNRINILLSRAQHGMYIIGNANTARRVSMWDTVLKMLEKDNNYGRDFELCCPRHAETPCWHRQQSISSILLRSQDARCPVRSSCVAGTPVFPSATATFCTTRHLGVRG